MSAERFQLAIVGSGFAGSIVALIARRQSAQNHRGNLAGRRLQIVRFRRRCSEDHADQESIEAGRAGYPGFADLSRNVFWGGARYTNVPYDLDCRA